MSEGKVCEKELVLARLLEEAEGVGIGVWDSKYGTATKRCLLIKLLLQAT